MSVVGTATYAGYRTRTVSVAGEGPPVVLLHGYSDCANTWDGVLDEIARLGRAAVAVDLPGFGLADPLRPGPVLPQLDAFVDALVTDVAARGAVVLVGNSLGGTTAVRASGRDLPLAGVVTIGDPAAGRWWAGVLAGSVVGRVLLRLLVLPIPGGAFRRVMRPTLARLTYADPRLADHAVVDRFVTWMVTQGGPRALVRQVCALAAEIVDGRDRADVVVPLLIVHGAKDRIVPVRGARALRAAVPGSQLVVRPRWGHCPQLDDPRAVAELVTRFGEIASVRSVG
jgi:pimeloyl-ACP methyl ester carboxylesterase